ncbi:MAG: M20/M25/M40 family metallo-hydrolase, partial [Deltaproteobacteria bacterium]
MTWPIAILLAAWSVLPLPRQDLPDTKPISSAALLRHVAFLADDDLAGRGICTPGLDTAAAYIADAFRSAGLEPAGSSGSYFHSFEATVGVTLTGENHLIVKRGGETLPLELDEDFIPFGFSESGAFHDIEVVFAGYGITDPEQGYDDYAGLDVTGKAVLVLRHEPPRGKDAGWSHHALFRTKAQNARAHGAAAILIVNDPRSHPEGEEEDELVALRQGGRIGITALHLRERAGAHLLGDLDLAALQKEIDETRKPASRPLPDLRIDLAVSLERRKCMTKNVVGLLPGNSDEYVVIGAHYDHLGMGGTSSLATDEKPAIHNGADDNASGVAGMLELARVFAAEGTPPQKNLLFIAFTGEESGLLGSAAFVRETKIPLDRITAMINLDMIGRMRDNRLTIFGVETATAFREIVERTTPGLTVTTHGDGYGPSDQTSFYVKKIPVLFYFTGAHRDYHKPSDDVEKINVAGMARVTHAVYLAVR